MQRTARRILSVLLISVMVTSATAFASAAETVRLNGYPNHKVGEDEVTAEYQISISNVLREDSKSYISGLKTYVCQAPTVVTALDTLSGFGVSTLAPLTGDTPAYIEERYLIADGYTDEAAWNEAPRKAGTCFTLTEPGIYYTYGNYGALEGGADAVIVVEGSSSGTSPSPSLDTSPTVFSDVATDAWYAKDVNAVKDLGIISGKGNGKFDPQGNLTVAEAITLAAKTRAFYNKETIPSAQGEWYTSSVAYAVAQGIMKDNDFSSFDENATRAEMAYLFANALPAENYRAINSISALPDVTSTTKYSNEIFKLYSAGIVSGSDKYGSFKPSDSIVRAEAAAILNRVVNEEGRNKLTLETK